MKNENTNRKGILRVILALTLVVSMLASAALTCFAEELDTVTPEETTDTTVTGITNVSVSLNEGIVVKFYTNAGTKISVEFGGETTELTDEDEDYVYEFLGVTPQKMNDTVTATLYDESNAQVGDTKSFTVKEYLTKLLALDFEGSGCASTLQYEAMRELAVNMLNYGAAAQAYVNYNAGSLANADLSDEQKALATETIDVTETDSNAVGSAWLGAGVNFAEKLGLYFVFTADSADYYTATINGETVTAEEYPSQGDNAYVIRYEGFNATNMNNVVTATLMRDGETDQTFDYSVRSYVYSKGGNGNALSSFINATYAYGFGAVAYAAEYEWTTEPTLEADGAYAIKEDSKRGYDFTDSKYASGTVTKLNFTDYETETTKTTTSEDVSDNKGYKRTHNVVTTFTQIEPVVNLTVVKESDNCININGTFYSQYDYEKANVANEVAVAYTDGEWSYDAITEQTLTNVTTHGAPLTVTGKLTVNRGAASWAFDRVNVTLGTAEKAADITVISTYSVGVRVWNNANMLIAENSKLDIQCTGTYGITVGNGSEDEKAEQSLTVDGTLTANGAIHTSTLLQSVSSYEYGFKPAIFIRKGTATGTFFRGHELQVGSEKDGFSGTLNLTKATKLTYTNNDGQPYLMHTQFYSYAMKYIFAKGKLNMSNGGDTAYRGIGVLSNQTGYIDFREGMDVTVEGNCTKFITKFYRQGNFYVTAYKDCVSGMDGDDYFIYGQTGAVHTSGYADVQMTVDGNQKTVRVANYNKVFGDARDDGIVDTETFSELVAGLDVPENAELTTSTTEKTIGLFGTFYQGTYVDANGTTQTIYYQILD